MNDSGYDQRSEQGVALVITLLFLAALGLISTALVFTVQAEMRSSTSYKYTQQAFHVANAGVQKSLEWFVNSYTPHLPAADYDSTAFPVQYSGNSVLLAGQTGSSSAFPGSGVISSFTAALRNQVLLADAKNSGTYAVNATLVKYIPTTFIDPATFLTYPSAVERWRINSIGYWGPVANPLGISQINAMIENSGNAVFDRALWGIDSVSLGGTVKIDSYDPALGGYGGTNIGDNGAIGSNGSVTMGGNTSLMGDAAYGPTGTFTATSNVTVSGDIIHLQESRSFPPIPAFSVGSTNINVHNETMALNPGSYGRISIGSNGILQLHPGAYYIDEISENATARLEILNEPGITTIFIKSALDLSGQGVLNPAGDPTKLTIVYAGTSELKLVGGTGFYGEVYAPNAPIKLAGNSDFFGAFIGKTVTDQGTPSIHFDEGALKNNLIQRPFRIITWSQGIY